MKKITISSLTVIALMASTSCRTDFDTQVSDVKPTSGEANFTTYVALGNSLTSGYRDGALYTDAQMESYPSIIAEQMKKAGGGEFTQPLMPDNIGGFAGINGFQGKLSLQLINNSLVPLPAEAKLPLTPIKGSFNNMGVPGAKSFHLVAKGYGSMEALKLGKVNPYFVRFASAPATSVLNDAMAKKPTFFSLWIGNNDVLFYAASGGTGTDQTGNINPATYGSNDITDPKVLAGSIKGILDGMKAVGATKGVIANIPDITSIPFFTTVPAKPLKLAKSDVDQLNAAYSKYNAGLKKLNALGAISNEELQQRLISFNENKMNGVVIEDKDLTNLSAYNVPSYRQTTEKDYILLTTLSLIKKGGGTRNALEDKHILTAKEAGKVQSATKAYNATIQSLATAYNLAFVDAGAKLTELNKGIQFNGTTYTSQFVSGGAFSLDGIHLTGRGYAVIANEFIQAINKIGRAHV